MDDGPCNGVPLKLRQLPSHTMITEAADRLELIGRKASRWQPTVMTRGVTSGGVSAAFGRRRGIRERGMLGEGMPSRAEVASRAAGRMNPASGWFLAGCGLGRVDGTGMTSIPAGFGVKFRSEVGSNGNGKSTAGTLF